MSLLVNIEPEFEMSVDKQIECQGCLKEWKVQFKLRDIPASKKALAKANLCQPKGVDLMAWTNYISKVLAALEAEGHLDVKYKKPACVVQ